MSGALQVYHRQVAASGHVYISVVGDASLAEALVKTTPMQPEWLGRPVMRALALAIMLIETPGAAVPVSRWLPLRFDAELNASLQEA
jgi:hypothetical protein